MPSKQLGTPPRIVLDTNILVSAAINKLGIPRRIFKLWRSGKLSLIANPEKIPEAAADRDDNQILAAAIEGKADTIVSGDEHLLGLKNYRRIKVMTAKQFLQSRKLSK